MNQNEEIPMSGYNGSFREIGISSQFLESVPSENGLWFESETDRTRRQATQEFYETVKPTVWGLLDRALTSRQKEVVRLYYLCGKSQEDIAAILDLSQSTVSRHLFGTVRGGKKVGGAIPKLRKAMSRTDSPVIDGALKQLQLCFAQTA